MLRGTFCGRAGHMAIDTTTKTDWVATARSLAADFAKSAARHDEDGSFVAENYAALRAAKLYDRLVGKFVFGENVSQSAQFVQSGNADIGILPLSLARSPALGRVGRFATLPDSLYAPIEQAAIILRSSHAKDAARAFLAFLKQPQTGKALAEAGFGPPLARAAR